MRPAAECRTSGSEPETKQAARFPERDSALVPKRCYRRSLGGFVVSSFEASDHSSRIPGRKLSYAAYAIRIGRMPRRFPLQNVSAHWDRGSNRSNRPSVSEHNRAVRRRSDVTRSGHDVLAALREMRWHAPCNHSCSQTITARPVCPCRTTARSQWRRRSRHWSISLAPIAKPLQASHGASPCHFSNPAGAGKRKSNRISANGANSSRSDQNVVRRGPET